MNNFPRLVCLSLLASCCALTPAHAELRSGSSSARPLITQKIDNSNLVTLDGNNRGVGHGIDDRGAVAEDFKLDHMMLQLKRSPEQEKALANLMEQQNARGNPNYHRWLSEQDFDESFGVNRSDVEKVAQWLASYGFVVNGVTPDGLVIDFSGTAGMVRSAFHTELHNLQLKNGEKHFSNITDPKIPLALAAVVAGPVALHDFKPHPLVKRRNPATVDSSGHVNVATRNAKGDYTFAGCGGNCDAFTPGDAQKIYNIKPLLSAGTTGKGQTIGLIEDSDDYTDVDWTTFMSTFGLAGYGGTLATVHPQGSMTCTDPGNLNNGTDVEVELDIEYASATAPGANVVIESCADSTTAFGGLFAVQNLASATNITTPILSISYGQCEAENGAAANAAFSSAYQHAASRGISIFVSSGDESSVSCDANQQFAEYGTNVSGFASTPYNVAVGGTDFGDTYAGTNATYWGATNSADYSSALSYVPEIPWNDSCASELLSTFEGFTTTYGIAGFCNSAFGQENFATVASGSGGPSNCYTGSPQYPDVGTTGTCQGQPKPSWQTIVGNPTDGVRDIPDVSLFAANGLWSHYIVICMSNVAEGQGGLPCTAGDPSVWTGVGGTSASSPMMAGIQALINESTGQLQGNPAPVYYTLAAQEFGKTGNSSCNSTLGNLTSGSCTFYDITQGDMNVPCFYLEVAPPILDYNCFFGNAGGGNDEFLGVGSLTDTSYAPTYKSTVGWDFATGIGSINAYNLVTNWSTAKVGSSTAITATPQAVPEGSTVSLTATVALSTSNVAAGTVTFKYGGISLGSCTLSGGTCTYAASSSGIPPGTYHVTAVYSGLGIYATSTSPAVAIVVGAADSITTSTALTVTPNPVGQGFTVQLAAAVSASSGTPTGTVKFSYGTQVVGDCTLTSGACSVSRSTAGLPLGSYAVVATYLGGGTYLTSASVPVTVTVDSSAIDTVTSLTANPNPVIEGSTVALTASVTSSSNPVPGKINFTYGSTLLGSCTLSGGSCTLSASTNGIPHGTYQVKANYLGQANYQPSSSGALDIVLGAPTKYSEVGLHNFTGQPDGGDPEGGLAIDSQGNIYGTTDFGGTATANISYGGGTVWEVNSSGTETQLYNFAGGSDGSFPVGSLLRDTTGNLYGTVVGGGTNGYGGVFKLTSGGTESLIYNAISTDGAISAIDSAGNLYGTTQQGGSSGQGSVFVINPSTGQLTTLYSFTGGADGAQPIPVVMTLVLDASGTNLYGTTSQGGFGFGVVFKLNIKSGLESVLHSFASGNDGSTPEGGVVLDSQGNVYGTTLLGGKSGDGTIYEINSAGTESILYSFTNQTDGGFPVTGLALDSSGNLYGNTGNTYQYETNNYENGFGTMFEINSSGFTTLFSFNYIDGLSSLGNPVLDPQGNIYGVCQFGGSKGFGIAYKLLPSQ